MPCHRRFVGCAVMCPVASLLGVHLPSPFSSVTLKFHLLSPSQLLFFASEPSSLSQTQHYKIYARELMEAFVAVIVVTPQWGFGAQGVQ